MDVEAIGRVESARRRFTFRSAVCLVATVLLLPANLPAQRPTDYDVKAAYLFNFGKFLRQPDTPHQPSFDICVLGHDDFGGALDKLTANEQLNGVPEHTIHVENAVAARRCAIVFISGSEADRVKQDLSDLVGSPVLTVSDVPHFVDRGGMIEFATQAKHVRFSVGLDAVTKAGLGLSSELLKVALAVSGGPQWRAQ
jgi:YfiR/HmsC-like